MFVVERLASSQTIIKPADWSETLERMLALHPAVIVPGHGQVLRDEGFVKQLVLLFRSISEQVDAAAKRGETLEQTHARINLDQFERQFAVESRMRKLIFRNYVRGPAIDAAFADAKK